MFAQKRKLFSVTLVIYKIEPRTIVFTATMATMMNGRVKKNKNDVIKVFDKKNHGLLFTREKSWVHRFGANMTSVLLFYKKSPTEKKMRLPVC